MLAAIVNRGPSRQAVSLLRGGIDTARLGVTGFVRIMFASRIFASRIFASMIFVSIILEANLSRGAVCRKSGFWLSSQLIRVYGLPTCLSADELLGHPIRLCLSGVVHV